MSGTIRQDAPSAEEWADLTDPKKLSKRRKAAEEQVSDLSQDQIERLRKRAKTDLFFLAYGLLDYDLLSHKLHGHLCLWLERNRDRQYRMTLLPRGHYKSTLITIADAIQMALPNDAGVEEYPYSLGPNIKLLIAHENRESASRFLFEITEAFMKKPAMLALFPDCVPDSKEQRINKWELELPRSKYHKEPTFDTIGAGGAAQGRHYHHIKMDDIIGEKARESETVMGRTIDWFDNVNSLLTRPRFDGWDIIGTRWSHSDVYSHAMKMYGVDKDDSIIRCMNEEQLEEGVLATYARGAIEDGEPIFPEEFDMEMLNRIRKSPKVWAAQYANNPKESGLLTFDPENLKFYNVAGQGRIVVFEGTHRRSLRIQDLDICVLIDPSVGESEAADESGIVVTGTDDRMNVYVLETVKKRMRPPELIDKMIQLYQKWKPRKVSVEEVAFSATYKYWFKQECERLGIAPSIHDYKPGSKRSKSARIEGLANYTAGGQIYVLEGMSDLREEFESYPLTDSEHLLDALAQGPEVWTASSEDESFKYRRQSEKRSIESRSPVTGY